MNLYVFLSVLYMLQYVPIVIILVIIYLFNKKKKKKRKMTRTSVWVKNTKVMPQCPAIYLFSCCVENLVSRYSPPIMQGPFSCNSAKVLISSQVVHIYIYILQLWGMLRECTLGSSRVLCFYQHKIYNYNTCSCCTS